MAEKKSGLVKNVVLLLIVAACGVGTWYFVTQRGSGAMDEFAAQEWFESGDMALEGLDLEGVKTRLNHDAPQDGGEGRYRFDMRHVDPQNTLIVEVVIRGDRAISYTIIERAT